MLLRLCAAALFMFTGCVDDTSSSTQASTDPTDAHPACPPPPDEAFAACASSAADAACSFDIDGHHVDGTCKTGPDGTGELACAPDHPPPPRPPAEALAACESSTADAACSFDIDGHHVDGTCKAGKDDAGPLACAPNQRPPHP